MSTLHNESESVNRSVLFDSLRPYGLWPSRPLCPWDSPGKNGVGCHALLQGNLPDPGIEPGSPALQAGSLPSESPGKLLFRITVNRKKAHRRAVLVSCAPAPHRLLRRLCAQKNREERKGQLATRPACQSRTFIRKRMSFLQAVNNRKMSWDIRMETTGKGLQVYGI